MTLLGYHCGQKDVERGIRIIKKVRRYFIDEYGCLSWSWLCEVMLELNRDYDFLSDDNSDSPRL